MTEADDFGIDTWEWFDTHDPDCELVCESLGGIVARAWRAPDGAVWVVTGTRAQPVNGEHYGGPRDFLLNCPDHGSVLVPSAWVLDLSGAADTRGSVQCTDPSPIYRRPR